MLNTLVIIGRVEATAQHGTPTGARMTVYHVVTHSAERMADTDKYKNTVYHPVIGFEDAANAAQVGDIVCVVGRVQLRKSSYNGAWEYSCIAESVTQVSESQAKILQEEIAKLRQKLSAMQKRYKDETSRVEDVMSAPAPQHHTVPASTHTLV